MKTGRGHAADISPSSSSEGRTLFSVMISASSFALPRLASHSNLPRHHPDLNLNLINLQVSKEIEVTRCCCLLQRDLSTAIATENF